MTDIINTIHVPIKVSDETLGDILETAFNSASYWLYGKNIKHKGGFNFDLLVPITDDDSEFERNTLCKRKLLKGLIQYISEYGIASMENGEVNSCVLDGCDCDIILQFALFGEQVFG
jgi:hypothetical protein